MIQFLNALNIIFMLEVDDVTANDAVTSPLYDGIGLIGPYAISIVGMLSLFYGIFLGVKFAKAEDATQKANLQKTLVNFIIGAVTIIVLISVVYAIRGPLVQWMSES